MPTPPKPAKPGQSSQPGQQPGQPTGTAGPGQPPQPDQREDPAAADRDEALAEQEELAPEQPVEVAIDPRDSGVVFHTTAVRDGDVEVPDDAGYQPAPPEPQDHADDDVQMIEGEQVEYIDAASSSNALALGLNGTTYLLGAQGVGQLKQIIDKAVVGLSL